MLARMDETKLAEARQKLREVSFELAQAAEAARAAADIHLSDPDQAWRQLQQVYTRFDQAAQLLREMRRVADEAMGSR